MAYPTLSEFKSFISITGAGDDANLTFILDQTIAMVEKYTGRLFVSGAAANRGYPADIPYVTQGAQVLTPRADLASITSVTNGNGVAIVSGDYYVFPIGDTPIVQIRLKLVAGLVFVNGSDGTQIVVNGQWGYSVACPDDIFTNILELANLAQATRHDGSGQSLTSRGIIIDKSRWPERVLRNLKGYRR